MNGQQESFGVSTPRSEAAGPRAVASFRWIDGESQEELRVDVQGCESFFEELCKLGFERLDPAHLVETEHRRGVQEGRRALVEATPAHKEQRARRGA